MYNFPTERDKLISYLYELGECRIHPNKETINYLIDLIRHEDIDVRCEAIRVSGIHFMLKDSFFPIKSLLKTEKDELILKTIVNALGTLAFKDKANKDDVTRLLASIVRANCYSDTVRGTAYLNLCRIHNKITIQEYASSSDNINALNYDKKWIDFISR